MNASTAHIISTVCYPWQSLLTEAEPTQKPTIQARAMPKPDVKIKAKARPKPDT